MWPQEEIEDYERGLQYFSGLNTQYIGELRQGCSDCKPKSMECLQRTLKAIEYKIELDQYDDIAIENLRIMKVIIGDFVALIPPSVDAGNNQSVQVGNNAIFNAVATQGSAPIVSYLWEKVSGGTVTLTNTNTASLTASNFGVGNYVFRVTVTDENDLTASDTVQLTGTAQQIQVRWGAFDTEPDLNTVVLPNSMNINAGATEFTIPFGVGSTNKFIVYDYPSTEVNKVNWFNTTLNYGTVPDSTMKAQVTVGGRKRIGSRDLFIFDSSTYTLKASN